MLGEGCMLVSYGGERIRTKMIWVADDDLSEGLEGATPMRMKRPLPNERDDVP
jgi:hypothetical protein